MSTDFSRFIDAQETTYATALAELRAGRKRTHWIWFVFPQIAGLGSSWTSSQYAIAGASMARAYLRHPVLGARYLEAVAVVHSQVCNGNIPIERLMGSHIDALKLVSSLTLFGAVAEETRLVTLADAILEVAARQGFVRCAHTELAVRD
ncbi:MAG: DUF1810 family protein [Deltaproteobacteria bacterium]|nr:DUF1810 family protein [Deltaproteobacteria bacterium]